MDGVQEWERESDSYVWFVFSVPDGIQLLKLSFPIGFIHFSQRFSTTTTTAEPPISIRLYSPKLFLAKFFLLLSVFLYIPSDFYYITRFKFSNWSRKEKSNLNLTSKFKFNFFSLSKYNWPLLIRSLSIWGLWESTAQEGTGIGRARAWEEDLNY